jgi:hypothetical protein
MSSINNIWGGTFTYQRKFVFQHARFLLCIKYSTQSASRPELLRYANYFYLLTKSGPELPALVSHFSGYCMHLK